MDNLCNNCIHKDVCGKFTATGGVRKCENFKTERRGRWIHPKGYVVSNGFLCSECGHKEASHRAINPRPGGAYLADDNGNFFYPPKINYCPNCGVKMDGGDE